MRTQTVARTASVFRNYTEPVPTHTCSACELCNPAERKRKTNKSIAQPSRCSGQYMSWARFRISEVSSGMVHEGTKRSSYSSVARRIPNIWSNIESTPRGQKGNKSRKELRQQKKPTSGEPIREYGNCRHDNNTKLRSVHEFSGQEKFACLI